MSEDKIGQDTEGGVGRPEITRADIYSARGGGSKCYHIEDMPPLTLLNDQNPYLSHLQPLFTDTSLSKARNLTTL